MNVIAQQPFGAVVQSDFPGQALLDLNKSKVLDWLGEHLLLIFRGYAPADDSDYVQFAEQFGPLLEWEFGKVLELKICPRPPNHIFTAGRVELHWDGAYVADKPHYNLFQCISASKQNEGGETLFVNTPALLCAAQDAERELWKDIVIDYATEKKAHYGGSLSEFLCTINPYNGQRVIRFIEPFNEDNAELNPVQVRVRHFSEHESDQFLRDFTRRLYRDDVMYRHRWRAGDYLIADNASLLHGRSRFRVPDAARHIKRINIL